METTQATAADLVKYDMAICIDRSGSMGKKDMPNGVSRWKAAQEATGAFARKATEFDADGIDVGVFGGETIKVYNNVTGTDELLDKIFTENEPNSGTPTGKMLKQMLDRYFADKAAGKSPKPLLIGVITDGQPDSRDEVANVIVEATKKMDSDGEIAISFLQIGNDEDATNFLQFLDDGLTAKGAKFDIVDTKKLNNVDNITECMLAAIND